MRPAGQRLLRIFLCRQRLPAGEVSAEEQVETLVGLSDDVIDLRRAAAALDCLEEARQFVEVRAAESARVACHFTTIFHIFNARDVVKREVDLRRVEHLEDDYLV